MHSDTGLNTTALNGWVTYMQICFGKYSTEL